MNVQQATEESIEDEPNLGTPKAPRLRFAGEPGRPCPGAPSKGRTPRSFYDLSEDAPVRRLNFMRCIDSSSVPVQSAACDDAAICGLQYEQPQQLSGQDDMQLLVQQQQQLMCQNETSDPPQQEQHRLLTSPGYRSLQCQHQLKHTPTLTAIPGHFKQQRSHQHSVWNALPPAGTPGIQQQHGSGTPARLFR